METTTTSTRTSTSILTTTTITDPSNIELLKVVITGSFILTTPDSAAFLNDDVARDAVAAGVAQALAIPQLYVTLNFQVWAGKMRRRLAAALTVTYTISIPVSASTELKTKVPKEAMGLTAAEISAAVQAKVAEAKGAKYKVSVDAKTVPKIAMSVIPARSTSCSVITSSRYWVLAAISLLISH